MLIGREAELPAELYTAAGVRELDRLAIEVHGVPGYMLMQRAAAAAYRVLRLRWPAARDLAIYCGTGNNGGDGLVLARLALADGLRPRLAVQGDPARIGGDAASARDDWLAAGGRIETVEAVRPEDADVLVDALLGTGLDRALRDDWAALVERLASAARPVLAIDVPTGLNADTGAIMGALLPADCTVSFIGLKRGLFTADGPDACGRLVFADLALSPLLAGALAPAARLLPQALGPGRRLARAANAHKGSFGHVLVVGGNRGMGGAARLAAEAALRAGAGLVSVAVHPESIGINASRPELMVQAVRAAGELAPLLERATVLAAGPGLGRDAWGESLAGALRGVDLPSVVDADALYWLGSDAAARADRVLTPHPGEAARLLDRDGASIQHDRFASAHELARIYGGCVVLKGQGTVIASQDAMAVNCSGHAGMASAGSGDVLTGLIAALLAQGLDAWQAACLGVWRHGHAADLLVRPGQPLPAGELAAALSAESMQA